LKSQVKTAEDLQNRITEAGDSDTDFDSDSDTDTDTDTDKIE